MLAATEALVARGPEMVAPLAGSISACLVPALAVRPPIVYCIKQHVDLAAGSNDAFRAVAPGGIAAGCCVVLGVIQCVQRLATVNSSVRPSK